MARTISVTVEVTGDSKKKSLKNGSTAAILLDELNLLPDAHIVVKDGKPIPITQVLKDGDRIRIIRVASGG